MNAFEGLHIKLTFLYFLYASVFMLLHIYINLIVNKNYNENLQVEVHSALCIGGLNARTKRQNP